MKRKRLHPVPASSPKGKGSVLSFGEGGLVAVLLLLAIIGMNACRLHKKATTSPLTEGAVFYTSCYPVKSLSAPSCKLEISYGDKSYSLNGSIYIRPDSICFFRGKMMVEVIRGCIYRDSFVVVNYLDRICYKGKNEYLQEVTGYPVNPESLMMLFTADRCEETYCNKFNFVAAPGGRDKILLQGNNRCLLEMNINADNRTVNNISLYNSQHRQALFSVAYGGYSQYPQFTLPAVFDISARDGKNPIRIKANFQQVLFNQPLQVAMNIPSKYKVVTLRNVK